MPTENNELINFVNATMKNTTKRLNVPSDNRCAISLNSFIRMLENDFGDDFKYGVFYTVYSKCENGQLKKDYFGLETDYEHKSCLNKDFDSEYLVKAKWKADDFAKDKTDASIDKTYLVWFKNTPMVCIDIDEDCEIKDVYKNYPFLKNAPYMKGNTKGYHFFVQNDFFKNYNGSNNCLNIFTGDMKSMMTFEKYEKKVFVKDGVSIPEISKEDAQKVFNHEDILSWEKKDKKDFDEQNEQKRVTSNFDINEVSDFLNNIKTKYCDDYHTWAKIVSALKNIGCYELIHNWSKKSKKYDEYKVNEYLRNNDYKSVTFGSIKHYSKLSNQDKHFELHNKWRKSKIELSDPLADDDFCKLYLEDNDEIFYHDGDDNKCIFIYNKLLDIWSKAHKPEELTDFIIKRLHPIFLAGLQKLEKENWKLKCESLKKCDDDCEICSKKKKLRCKAEILEKNIFKIKSNSTQNHVAKSIIAHLKCNPSDIPMDPNPNLFCWLDKSFDIGKNEFVERSFEDYVTITSGYKYEDYPKCTKEKLKKLDEILKDSLPDKEVRECYTSILRSGFTSQLLDKFVCINGKGRNGKGIFNKLMIKLVGNYGMTASPVILTKKIDGSKPDPSIANMDMKRFIDYSEPEEGDNAKASTIKTITGEQKLAVRGLYSNKSEINNRGTHICECNERLNIKGDVDNESMLQRYVDINFTCVFLSDDCKENIDKINNFPDTYKKKVPYYDTDEFRNEFKITLFHYIINNSKPDIFIPDVVRERSKQFLDSCNTILTYFYANYEKCEDNHYITFNDIWENYRYSEEYKNLDPKEKQLNKQSTVRERLGKKIDILPRKKINGIGKKNVIMGYKLIENEE